MKRLLRRFSIAEVSAVDKPAQKHARVTRSAKEAETWNIYRGY
jgi:hypothetical protein